jgi:hypothetical protein
MGPESTTDPSPSPPPLELPLSPQPIARHPVSNTTAKKPIPARFVNMAKPPLRPLRNMDLHRSPPAILTRAGRFDQIKDRSYAYKPRKGRKWCRIVRQSRGKPMKTAGTSLPLLLALSLPFCCRPEARTREKKAPEPPAARKAPPPARPKPRQPAPTLVTAGAHKLEVSLVPEPDEIMVGQPGFLLVAVRNRSTVDLQMVVGGSQRNRLLRADNHKLTVTDSRGTRVPVIHLANLGGISTIVRIPKGKTHHVPLFIPNWARFKKPGLYTIQCERKLLISEAGPQGDRKAQHRTYTAKPVPIRVTAQLAVVAYDSVKMGKVIEELGRTLYNTPQSQAVKAFRALKALTWLADPRVIPFLVKAIREKRYTYSYQAAWALKKFTQDQAVEGLKLCINDRNAVLRQTCAKALAAIRKAAK